MTISTKYIGLDVHKESISIAVRNAAGKIVMESLIETKASMILQFIDGLRGDLHVTFEEGTSAAWLYDLLKPHVTRVVVCDPRKNKSMREGNQSDKIDARRLAELLRLVLRRSGGQRHEAGDGAADLSKKDCHDRTDRMEEGGVLRRPTSETTNSLSVSDRVRSILDFSLAVAVGFSRHSGSRASLS
jgi:Transposase